MKDVSIECATKLALDGFIGIHGFIYDHTAATRKRLVFGYAFETPAWDWLHLWCTPTLEKGDTIGHWHVSHWETGARITWTSCSRAVDARIDAMKIVYDAGRGKTLEAIGRWERGESWPGK